MKALVIGATGAVGRDLVDLLLNDDAFSTVEIFVRRESEISSPKLIEHVVDFDNIGEFKQLLTGDVLFSCMGTTLKQAGSKKAQWKVDYDYQYDVAKAAARNGVRTYVLVSSIGAYKGSSIFYLQMKGKLDDEVKKLHFHHTVIMRPTSLIRKNSKRLTEKPSVKLLQLLNLIGIAKKYRPIRTAVVAQAMVNLAKSGESGYSIYTGTEIFDIGK